MKIWGYYKNALPPSTISRVFYALGMLAEGAHIAIAARTGHLPPAEIAGITSFALTQAIMLQNKQNRGFFFNAASLLSFLGEGWHFQHALEHLSQDGISTQLNSINEQLAIVGTTTLSAMDICLNREFFRQKGLQYLLASWLKVASLKQAPKA